MGAARRGPVAAPARRRNGQRLHRRLAGARAAAGAELFAADLSDEALAVAAENARRLGARVTLRRADALHHGLADAFPERFDAIVSNPPYVPESDRAAMHPNVRDHEPGMALFVPDDDRILFYRAIARAGRRLLLPGGRLYFEIYEHAAEETAQMLRRRDTPPSSCAKTSTANPA